LGLPYRNKDLESTRKKKLEARTINGYFIDYPEKSKDIDFTVLIIA